MERAITPPKPDGFSLIELLIAAAVLAVLAVGASLSVGRSGSARDSDQTLFQRNFEVLQQLAITGGQSRGLEITPRGMRLALRDEAGWQISEREQRWRGRVSVVTQGPNRGGDTPTVIFLATGQSTPFDVVFRSDDAVLRCRSDGWSGLTCDG